jgi:hypothetical protein
LTLKFQTFYNNLGGFVVLFDKKYIIQPKAGTTGISDISALKATSE